MLQDFRKRKPEPKEFGDINKVPQHIDLSIDAILARAESGQIQLAGEGTFDDDLENNDYRYRNQNPIDVANELHAISASRPVISHSHDDSGNKHPEDAPQTKTNVESDAQQSASNE